MLSIVGFRVQCTTITVVVMSQRRVQADSQMMIPDSEKRLAKAIAELKELLVSGRVACGREREVTKAYVVMLSRQRNPQRMNWKNQTSGKMGQRRWRTLRYRRRHCQRRRREALVLFCCVIFRRSMLISFLHQVKYVSSLSLSLYICSPL